MLSPRDVVGAGLCIGCGGCAGGGGSAESMRWDRYGQLKPAGPAALLKAPSGRFAATCPFSPSASDEDAIAAARFPDPVAVDPLIGRFAGAFVGHVAEAPFREQGSSGGMVSWVAAELLRRGLVDGVAHVVPRSVHGGSEHFAYRIARDGEAVGAGAKSRYHPVHLAEVLDEMRRVPGRYAVVGVPCFIKAVHLLRAEDAVLRERIAFTLGLFCGHMKSRRFVESFAWQLDVAPAEVAAVEYRLKDPGLW